VISKEIENIFNPTVVTFLIEARKDNSFFPSNLGANPNTPSNGIPV